MPRSLSSTVLPTGSTASRLPMWLRSWFFSSQRSAISGARRGRARARSGQQIVAAFRVSRLAWDVGWQCAQPCRSAIISGRLWGSGSPTRRSRGLVLPRPGKTPELSRCAAIPVSLLVVDGAEHVDGGVPAPPVVDRFEPVHGRAPSPRARRPRLKVDQLELVGGEERLRECVVPAYTRAARRLLHPVLLA
jgi:hypothetical protein